MSKFYLSYKDYMIKKYKKPLYSIPVDLDLGCPNRKSDGSGGCSFCPENGARAIQSLNAKSVEEQIKVGIAFAKKRYNATNFMLYLQAYTSTFTSLKRQKETYSNLLKFYKFDAISIGTRPDCLSDSTLEYLKELNKQIDVYIDLGVQSLNDRTLLQINREHDAKCSIDAIEKIKKYGLKINAHVIVGFKGESRDDWSYTVRELIKLGVDGLKIHNLHVIKNTPLYEEYKKEPFKTLNEYEYAEELIHLLRLIPKDIYILRFNTDTPKDELIAPIWHMQKGEFKEFVDESLEYLYGKSELESYNLPDGSITLWDEKFKDYYHPKSGAINQAQKVFIDKSDLKNRLEKGEVNLLDIGFGMGYNSLEALKLEKENSLHVKALDKNRAILKQSATLLNSEILERLYFDGYYKNDKNEIRFLAGDARYTTSKIKEKFDIIFLNPFYRDKSPSLLSYEFFIVLFSLLKDDGVLIISTYLNAIRVALSKAGFKSEILHVNELRAIRATKGNEKIEGNFYSDPYLVYRDKKISV
ncbi:TIGR01212 family radical SAM protein [Sulfurospirillum sp. 1307]